LYQPYPYILVIAIDSVLAQLGRTVRMVQTILTVQGYICSSILPLCSMMIFSVCVCRLSKVFTQLDTILQVKKGSLAKDSRPLTFSLLGTVATGHGAMSDDTVIPECNASRLPFPAHSQIIR
jgi:hypothetical protein